VTILYNTVTQIIEHRIDGEYLVDGLPGLVSLPMIKVYESVKPEYDPIIQYLVEEIQYIQGVWTHIWIILSKILPTLDEAKALKIQELKDAIKPLFQEIQWYLEILRNDGTPIPSGVKTKITAVATKYNQAKNQINGYTSVSDVLHWVVPYDQIKSLLTQLQTIN